MTWFRVGLTVALLTAPAAVSADDGRPLTFRPAAPGVWKATLGTPEDLTLLSAAGARPELAALGAMTTTPFPLTEDAGIGRIANGRLALRFPLGPDEDIYGLGVDFASMRRTGLSFQLHVDHWSGRTGRTHAPVPFYVSTKGYGVFLDSSRYLTVSVGLGVRTTATVKPPPIDRTTHAKEWAESPRSDSIEILVPAAGVNVYVFAGPTALDAVRRYNLFCGGGALPPKWGLGFMTRTPTAYTAEQALAEVAEFRSRGIPLDMLGLEPGWHDHAYPCSFEWDADAISRIPRLSRASRAAPRAREPLVQPVRVADGALYARLLPVRGIAPRLERDRARLLACQEARDDLLRTTCERTVVGSAAAAVGGFKVDEVDGYDRWLWPDVARVPVGQRRRTAPPDLRAARAAAAHRALPRATTAARSDRCAAPTPAPRPSRSSSTTTTTISNEYITAVANSWLRRRAVVAGGARRRRRGHAAPRSRPSASRRSRSSTAGLPSTKLWTHAAVVGRLSATAIRLRLRLLPYWYTTFAQYHFEGTPVIRADATRRRFTSKPRSAADPFAIRRVDETKISTWSASAARGADRARCEDPPSSGLPAGKLVRLRHRTSSPARDRPTIESRAAARRGSRSSSGTAGSSRCWQPSGSGRRRRTRCSPLEVPPLRQQAWLACGFTTTTARLRLRARSAYVDAIDDDARRLVREGDTVVRGGTLAVCGRELCPNDEVTGSACHRRPRGPFYR